MAQCLHETFLLDGTVIEGANSNSTETSAAEVRTKRATLAYDAEKEDVASFDEDEEEDEYTKSLVGEAKCKSKFWHCISKVVKGGMHYVDAPGGLSG